MIRQVIITIGANTVQAKYLPKKNNEMNDGASAPNLKLKIQNKVPKNEKFRHNWLDEN